MVLLHNKDRADAAAEAVTSALAPLTYTVETWMELNEFMVETTELGRQIVYLLYLIVLGIVAVVIVNTLLMTVFERTREMGILASFGMKAREIRRMFLIEAGVLAVVGIVLGVAGGSAVVEYLYAGGYPPRRRG